MSIAISRPCVSFRVCSVLGKSERSAHTPSGIHRNPLCRLIWCSQSTQSLVVLSDARCTSSLCLPDPRAAAAAVRVLIGTIAPRALTRIVLIISRIVQLHRRRPSDENDEYVRCSLSSGNVEVHRAARRRLPIGSTVRYRGHGNTDNAHKIQPWLVQIRHKSLALQTYFSNICIILLEMQCLPL